jgi:hypothetical protein
VGDTLTDVVQTNWPTPTGIHADRGNHDEPLENYNKRVKDYEDGRAKGKPGKSLGVAVRQTKTWATPQVTDSTRGNQIRKPNELTDAAKGGGCRNLREDVVNWATPNTMDHLPPRSEEGTQKMAQGQRKGRTRPSNLREQIDPRSEEIYKENWATPQTRDWKDTQGTSLERPRPSGKARGTNGLLPLEVYSQEAQVNNSKIGKPQEQLEVKRLSPLWVAQLMGLPTATWCVPVDWILCDYSETE